VEAIIPLTKDLVLVRFEHEYNEDDIYETLLFKRGRLQQRMVLPNKYENLLDNMDPDIDYDVYTAVSARNFKTFTMILKEYKSHKYNESLKQKIEVV